MRYVICFRLQAAIFDFSQIHTLGSLHSSLIGKLNPQNMSRAVEFRCYHAYELRHTLFPINFRLITAIFEFQHAQTSDGILTRISVLPDRGKHGYSRWNFVPIISTS